MTSFDVLGQQQLKQLIGRLRTAHNGKTIRRNLAAALRDAGRPVVADLRTAVLAIDVNGVQGRGTQRRAQAAAARWLRGRRSRGGGHGLRTSIARGAKATVRLSGRRVGLRIHMDNTHLPRSQRNLPAHLDNPKGWRHPVWGHRDRWVAQVGAPYFRKTVIRWNSRVRHSAAAAVSDALKELQQ